MKKNGENKFLMQCRLNYKTSLFEMDFNHMIMRCIIEKKIHLGCQNIIKTVIIAIV